MSAIRLSKATKVDLNKDFVLMVKNMSALSHGKFSKHESAHLKAQLKEKNPLAIAERNGQLMIVVVLKDTDHSKRWEKARIAGSSCADRLNALKRKDIQVISIDDAPATLALVEGMVLGSYSFSEYKTKNRKNPSLLKVSVKQQDLLTNDLKELGAICRSVNWARDLVNRPLSHLTATQLSDALKEMGKDAGFNVEILRKAKIESLKMGGLLAVNIGSPDPPTFSILEWKPKNAKNKKPVLLVGKGVVYDTGGLSLKPTPNSMDMMKCDMAGAACMAGVMHAISCQALPIHVVALIPATDNRPGGNAYAPGDVITMHDGQTVEVLNTDAEGRLIMADALSYGKRYNPELVIDAATLTGAAARAIGEQGVVAMGTAAEKTLELLSIAGNDVYERIALMPFWDEYDKDLDSDIADMKNLGGAAAGHITAGKFLARFVEAPFIHLDIAGTAYISAKSAYRPKGGTGVGVRLLYNFLKKYSR
jgi:leucyl aminopeptidase